MKKLSPLLRLAVVSGVEAAVKLHIHRGDDLDARDASGATPLMLAAARKKKGVVRLLLDAGATPTLVDSNGCDALAYASTADCPEIIALLADALARLVAEANVKAGEILNVQLAEEEIGLEVLVLDDTPLCPEFDEWEAEVESIAPEGDDLVVESARKLHETIGQHRAIDSDEDWGDVDLFLPDRALPFERLEEGSELRALLLRALREERISEDELLEVSTTDDGERNMEAERLLALVIGELGGTVVEWAEIDRESLDEASPDEEFLVDEAIEFVRELASGSNDPFRFYSKDVRGALLDAKEEIALGREMEEAGRDALVALAQWPEGFAALIDAADKTAHEAVDVTISDTRLESCEDAKTFASVDMGAEDGDDEAEPDDEVVAFALAAEAVRAGGRDLERVMEALGHARPSRRFLVVLAEKASKDPAGAAYATAMRRQSAARERMTLCNLRLALSIAKKYMRSGMPLDDLVQEANIGLMKAVERYDWRKGFRFSTYATWWIRQAVTRAIADKSRVVRAPVHAQEAARRIIRERDEVMARLGRPESDIETARRVGMSLARTQLYLTLFDDVASLDELDSMTGLTGIELLTAPDDANPEEYAMDVSLHTTLMEMLNDLEERSREVMILRFGFFGGHAMTLEGVGQQFGVTRERIRQIEAKALKKLSHKSRRGVLAPFIGSDQDNYLLERTPESA